MEFPLEDREEKELVSSSPDSGIGETDAQGRKLTEASVCQHNTQAQNSFANTLNPFFYKHQSVDNRKWALLKSLSQDSEYSLDDSLHDAEDILSQLGFAGSRDPTIPERFLPSLMQRLSEFPESEMMTMNDRILHSIGCFRRKEGKRRLFRNLSTGKDPRVVTTHQSSLTCPAANSYPLLRSNTGPAAFTYDDLPPGTTSNNSFANRQPIENEQSLPQSPIAILVSQASVDASSCCDGVDIASFTAAASDSGNEKNKVSISDDVQPANERDSACDDSKVSQYPAEDVDRSSYSERDNERVEKINFRKPNKFFPDDVDSFSQADVHENCELSFVPVPKSSSDDASVESEIECVPKIPLRRASSPQILDTIPKLSEILRNSSMAGFRSKARVTSSSDDEGESSIETSKFSSLGNNECGEYLLGDISPEKSSECLIRGGSPKSEIQFSRTSSLTNFLTSMLNAGDYGRCSDTSHLDGKSLQIVNDDQVADNKVLATQSCQQSQGVLLSDSKESEMSNSDMLTTSSELEGVQMDSCKGRVLRRMSWSSQRTHSFEVVDSESESNVNSQFSKLFPSNVPLAEQPELVAEIPKTDSLFCGGQETQSSDCKSLPCEHEDDNSIEKSITVINDDNLHCTHLRSLEPKKSKNVLKRPRIMSCPFPKELKSASCSPTQLSSSSDDLHKLVFHKNFHSDIGDSKLVSKVNVARRIKELQNRCSKRSSFPSASSLSFSKRKFLDQDPSRETNRLRSPPPSFASTSTVSTNDFFPSRASFETSRDHGWLSATEKETLPDAFGKESRESVHFQERETMFRNRLHASSSIPDAPLPCYDDSYVSDHVFATRQQSWDDISLMPNINSEEQSSHCANKNFINEVEDSHIVCHYSENGEFSPTADSVLRNDELFSPMVSPLKKNEVPLCVHRNSDENDRGQLFSNVSRYSEGGLITENESFKEVTSAGEYGNCLDKAKVNESLLNCSGTKPNSPFSVSPERFLNSFEVSRRLFLDRESTSLKASKSLPLPNSTRDKGGLCRELACNDNKREAMLERKIHSFSKLLTNMGNPVLRRGTMDDASGTLNAASDKRHSTRKCFTPPPEVDRLVCLLKKTLELKERKYDSFSVYRSEVYMNLDDSGRANPTRYSTCVSMDINKDDNVNSGLESHRKSELTSQEMHRTNHNTTGMTKVLTTELPFKEVSKELEELQMSIQKAKETRISASRELHFLQELLSGDSADDHRDSKMKKNKSKRYDKKISAILPETGFQEDMMATPGNAVCPALSDLREKSKKDVLEDTEFWREEIKKVKEENDRVWQERLNRMEDRLKSQEQDLIQAQNENEALQRRLELQRLGSSPCHCKSDVQNNHGRADSAFEDDEECHNHKPSTPTHSTRQDCERLQEQLIQTEQRADELNLLLNQKLIELNKLQISLSKQTKEMIELEKSYVQLQCRFRRGASKPVVSRLCSRSSPFSSKNLFHKPSPPASPGPTSICP